MPTHVYANNNEVASKAADGKSIAAFPDVCFSPPAPPVGPMPLPYPNTGEVKDTDSGTAKVFVKDKMSGMGDDSYMTKSMGDDASTKNFNKGMITGALQGKCYFGLWSMDVQMEGKGVPRHLDLVTHNHGSGPNAAGCESTLNAEAVRALKYLRVRKLRGNGPEYCFKIGFCDDLFTPLDKIKDMPMMKVVIHDEYNICVFSNYLSDCKSVAEFHASTKIVKIHFLLENASLEDVIQSINADSNYYIRITNSNDIFESSLNVDVRKIFPTTAGAQQDKPRAGNPYPADATRINVVRRKTIVDVGNFTLCNFGKNICKNNDGFYFSSLLVFYYLEFKFIAKSSLKKENVGPNVANLTAGEAMGTLLAAGVGALSRVAYAIPAFIIMLSSGYQGKVNIIIEDDTVTVFASIVDNRVYTHTQGAQYGATADVYRDGEVIAQKGFHQEESFVTSADEIYIGVCSFKFEQYNFKGNLSLTVNFGQIIVSGHGNSAGGRGKIEIPLHYICIKRPNPPKSPFLT